MEVSFIRLFDSKVPQNNEHRICCFICEHQCNWL